MLFSDYSQFYVMLRTHYTIYMLVAWMTLVNDGDVDSDIKVSLTHCHGFHSHHAQVAQL